MTFGGVSNPMINHTLTTGYNYSQDSDQDGIRSMASTDRKFISMRLEQGNFVKNDQNVT
jgi:hypothetical protein